MKFCDDLSFTEKPREVNIDFKGTITFLFKDAMVFPHIAKDVSENS